MLSLTSPCLVTLLVATTKAAPGSSNSRSAATNSLNFACSTSTSVSDVHCVQFSHSIKETSPLYSTQNLQILVVGSGTA
eukprot:scaffold37261_cov74-Phaeocystis_antarctica.AAC.5